MQEGEKLTLILRGGIVIFILTPLRIPQIHQPRTGIQPHRIRHLTSRLVSLPSGPVRSGRAIALDLGVLSI